MNSDSNPDLGNEILGELLIPSGSCIPVSHWPDQQSTDSGGKKFPVKFLYIELKSSIDEVKVSG